MKQAHIWNRYINANRASSELVRVGTTIKYFGLSLAAITTSWALGHGVVVMIRGKVDATPIVIFLCGLVAAWMPYVCGLLLAGFGYALRSLVDGVVLASPTFSDDQRQELLASQMPVTTGRRLAIKCFTGALLFAALLYVLLLSEHFTLSKRLRPTTRQTSVAKRPIAMPASTASPSASRSRGSKPELTNIENTMRDIIVERLGVNPDQVVPAARFREDLGADSLDLVKLTMVIEDEFSVEIPDLDADRLKTVGEVIEFVRAKAKGPSQ